MPVSFDPLRHPRDRKGRFTKSRTVLASSKDKKLAKEIAGGFKPAATGDGKAYAAKIADPPQQKAAKAFAADAKEINEDLRAGHADAAGVKPMDDAMKSLPDDLVLHRTVPAAAFGGIDPQSLQGMKVRDAGFTSTQLDPVQPSKGNVRMFIAAPKGSRAVANPDTGEVYLDRDSEMVVSHVAPNAAGGHDMYLTVLPKTTKGDPAPGVKPDAKSAKPEPGVADKPGKADIEKPAVADTLTKADTPESDGFRASLMKQSVADLQAQMRSRGLKPGKKRKSELVDALVADETGHDDKKDDAAAKPESAKEPEAKSAPKKTETLPAPKTVGKPAAEVEDQVRSAVDALIARDGAQPGTLVSLARLRDELGDMPRSDVDAALLRLDKAGVLQLEPDPHRAALTDRAKKAAIPLGGEDMHLVATVQPADKPDGKSFESRVSAAATGDSALNAAPLSLTRTDTHSRPGKRQGLTVLQRNALLDYRDDDYKPINNRLRDIADGRKGSPDKRAIEQTKNIDAAMAGSALTRNVLVYRGISSSRKVFGDRIDNDLTGMEWREAGFVSTSAVKSVTETFSGKRTDAIQMRIVAPAGASALQLSGVKDLSGHDDEAELLLNRGSRMRVVKDRGVVGGIRRLDVEVVL